jgi:hypothetical protein
MTIIIRMKPNSKPMAQLGIMSPLMITANLIKTHTVLTYYKFHFMIIGLGRDLQGMGLITQVK